MVEPPRRPQVLFFLILSGCSFPGFSSFSHIHAQISSLLNFFREILCRSLGLWFCESFSFFILCCTKFSWLSLPRFSALSFHLRESAGFPLDSLSLGCILETLSRQYTGTDVGLTLFLISQGALFFVACYPVC